MEQRRTSGDRRGRGVGGVRSAGMGGRASGGRASGGRASGGRASFSIFLLFFN